MHGMGETISPPKENTTMKKICSVRASNWIGTSRCILALIVFGLLLKVITSYPIILETIVAGIATAMNILLAGVFIAMTIMAIVVVIMNFIFDI